jgi:apolipoprotein N-acyltransferase
MSDSAVADPALGQSTSRPTPATSPSAPVPLGRAWGLLLAVVSGGLLALAFPGFDVWPLAPVAVAGLALATRGKRAGFAALAGFGFGLAFFVPHLQWSGIYVGAVPWFALAALESAFLAALGALLPRIWRVPGGLAGTTLAGAGLWVLQEAARGRLPFGGFPWGRLVFSQAEAPTAGLAAVGGAPLVTAVVAAIGVLLAGVVLAVAARVPRFDASVLPSARVGVVALVAAGVLLGAGLLVPLPTDGEQARVAAVQGSTPREGLEFNAERRAVLDNHVRGTLGLAARVQAGTAPAPDLVLWPENASDIDPLLNPDAAAVISQAVAAIKAPVLVGAVLQGPGEKLSNAGIVWRPGTGAGTGQDSTYVKRHPAPFGEYMPYRSFFRKFSSKVDLVSRDFVSGDTLRANPVGVLTMGKVKVGDVICFEVAYDGLVEDPVRQGATLLAVQTNNATFGESAESVQQLAMSQIRAIETGRSVVHISTVGVSAIIRPDGTIQQKSPHFTPDVLEGDVPLRTEMTLAVRVGAWPEGVLAGLAVALLLAGAFAGRRREQADRAALAA